MTPLLVGIVAVALIVVIGLVVRSRRSNDTVDSFRRGLDALSHEARRPVVDQVQHHSDNGDDGDDGGHDDDADDSDVADGNRGDDDGT